MYSLLILDPEVDASNYDQLNNTDFLCTTEAYARIGM